MRRSIFLLLAIIQIVNLNAQICSPDSLMLRSINAFDTDSNIDGDEQNHQVYINTDCEQNGQLLIHLVGSFDSPANTTFFPTLAANNGFKVINLKYINSVAAVSACANSNEADCFKNYRQEIIHGENSSPLVAVDPANSIVNRVEKLLAYLQENFPSEQWGDFLQASGEIKWSTVLISGHSQGGGHAAFIAKEYEVDRVLMFAAPNDYSDFFSSPATWLSAPSSTPSSNYFAFGNLFDNAVDFNQQFENWTAMNLLAQTDSTNVDNKICWYNNSNVLYTEYSSASGIGNHSAVIIDVLTPLAAGTPIFTPVWEYMLGLCGGSTSTSAAKDYVNSITLFPNPTSSNVFIKSETKISKVELYSASGSLLKTIQPMQKEVELNVEAFKGLLFLNSTLEGSTIQLRDVLIVN